MYQNIVVPLDGSKLAESVIPHVEVLAKGCDTEEVILISVTERIPVKRVNRDTNVPWGYKMLDITLGTQVPDPGAPTPQTEPTYAGAVGRKYKQAQRYLGRIAKRLTERGIKVRTEVLLGNPAEEIANFAEHDGVDLIVMASHGRSGPSRWAYGSVADKVFRASCVPVLMVRAPGCIPGI